MKICPGCLTRMSLISICSLGRDVYEETVALLAKDASIDVRRTLCQ